MKRIRQRTNTTKHTKYYYYLKPAQLNSPTLVTVKPYFAPADAIASLPTAQTIGPRLPAVLNIHTLGVQHAKSFSNRTLAPGGPES